MNDRERALSALYALDPACDRERRVRVSMAAKAAGLHREDFIDWRRQAGDLHNERECARVWDSSKNGSIGPGTLYYMAREAGWQDPTKQRRRDGVGRNVETRVQQVSTPHSAPQKPASEVAELWARFIPATPAHPYIVAKGGTAHGLRVVPPGDSLIVSGQSVAGWLAVPAIAPGGVLHTMQLIPPPGTGKKLNLPGASFGDGFFLVGDEAKAGRLFVVEGIGQAWACARATDGNAVVSFGAGRLSRVAEVVRQSYPARQVCIVPDRGKEVQAAEIARAIDGEWVELPADTPANYDANDYAADHGDESLAALLANPKKPERRYKLLAAGDLMSIPPLRWLVRGVVPASGLCCIFGPSGSGKSFLALDMAAAVAAGAPWFGYRVTGAPVVYVALEGEAGIRQRVKAWQARRGRDVPQSLRFVLQPFDLRRADDVAELADAIVATGGAGGMVILDTLSRASSGADENSSKDMGELIDAGKVLQTRLGGIVLFVHHVGKDAAKGMRGHSSLHAALDAAVEVTRTENRREWRIAKSKDEGDSAAHPFRLDVVTVGTDEYGDPVTSCVVTPDEGAGEVRRALPPKAGNQRVVWDVLGELARRAPPVRPPDAPERAPFGTPVVPLQTLLDEVRDRLACDPKRKAERAQQAVTGLQSRGLLDVGGGYVWPR
jgi:putative DNA primase/helicase